MCIYALTSVVVICQAICCQYTVTLLITPYVYVLFLAGRWRVRHLGIRIGVIRHIISIITQQLKKIVSVASRNI